MNPAELRRLNELWAPVYPYLARQVAELVPAEPAAVLELGPFSGGLSLALAARWPRARFTLAASGEDLAVLRTLALPGGPPGNHPQITLAATALTPLALPEKHYDLVIFRGAFFFLTPEILREAFRVLKGGGVGFLGGGYGRYTPPELIASLAEESRDLNYRLGKRWISPAEVEGLIAAAGLATEARLTSEGGLWIILRRMGKSTGASEQAQGEAHVKEGAKAEQKRSRGEAGSRVRGAALAFGFGLTKSAAQESTCRIRHLR